MLCVFFGGRRKKSIFFEVLRTRDKLGRLLADYASNPIKLQRKRDSSPRIDVYGDKNDYAL